MHVVHLEDEKPLQDILKLALEVAVPQVKLQQFSNSDKAYQYIYHNLSGIDLYIFDIRVPGTMNGLQLAQRVRDLKSNVPIILTSAYMQPSSELLNLLSCSYITKPWQILDLTQQVGAMIKRA
jgi:DNA-binding response OmpR family regulator